MVMEWWWWTPMKRRMIKEVYWYMSLRRRAVRGILEFLIQCTCNDYISTSRPHTTWHSWAWKHSFSSFRCISFHISYRASKLWLCDSCSVFAKLCLHSDSFPIYHTLSHVAIGYFFTFNLSETRDNIWVHSVRILFLYNSTQLHSFGFSLASVTFFCRLLFPLPPVIHLR